MDDITLVEVVETLQDLFDKIPHERFFEGTVVAEQSGNRSTRYIFQEDV
jgi:hypothetical protein